MGPEHSMYSSQFPNMADLSADWRPRAFWVPKHVALGFPLIVVSDLPTAQEWAGFLESHSIKHALVSSRAAALAGIFEHVQILYGKRLDGMSYTGRLQYSSQLTEWLIYPYSLGDSHSAAYSKFVLMPLAATEDVMGVLGPNVWHDFDALLIDFIPPVPIDAHTWRTFWKLVCMGRISEALAVGDSGTASDNFGGMTAPLWSRQQCHKQRHFFDVASLLILTLAEWTALGHRELFIETAKALLRACCEARMNYERMYFTLFWVCCSPYWVDISRVLLSKRLLYLSDAQ